MKVILSMLQFHLPGFIKKKKLEQLFAVTAHAFGCEAPQTKGLTFKQSLHKYALFTKQQTEKHLTESSNIDDLKDKLYQEAYKLGQELRKEFGIVDSKEVMLMMRMIYGLLEIDLRSNTPDEIIIKHCFFSDYYSPEICHIISSLDEGMAAGLSEGGELRFHQRITEGNNCCRGTFVRPISQH